MNSTGALTLGSNGTTTTLTIDTSQNSTFAGHQLVSADNTYDLCASAARCRSGYFGTSIVDPLHVGGSAVNQKLTLQSTSGIGTTDSIVLAVGNNGNTTALTINSGGVTDSLNFRAAAIGVNTVPGAAGTITTTGNITVGAGDSNTIFVGSIQDNGGGVNFKSAGFTTFNILGTNMILNQASTSTSGLFVVGPAATNANAALAKNGTGISVVLADGSGTTSGLTVWTFVVNGASLPAGYVFSVEAGTSRMNGRVYAANLIASSGLQTGVVCISASGELINDSVACLASSRRFKTILDPYGNHIDALTAAPNLGLMNIDALALVMKMQPVQFTYKNEGWNPDRADWSEHFGFFAEDVAKIEPRLVNFEHDGVTPHGVQYDMYTAVLTKAIQQLESRVVMLEAR